jgi:hypothetical protein
MAGEADAPAAVPSPGDATDEGEARPAAPRPGEGGPLAARPDPISTTATGGSGEAEAGEPAPSASVPLVARPAATAEPVGSALLFEGPPSPGSDDDAAPDTAEQAIVEGLPATGSAESESESAQALGAGAVAVAAPEPEPSAEISAARLEPSVFDFTAEQTLKPASDDAKPVGDDHDDTTRLPAADREEPAPLGPSTPAGARPRFPPPPPQEAGALPVGAAAVASAAALDGIAENGGAATTRRRERPPSSDGEDPETHAGGSVLRLLAAAVVIVAVLIFIATKVFSTGSTPAISARPPGPVPATIRVAVLNGTHASGLASQVSTVLSGLGFKRGFVGNALSQGHHVTLVGYTEPADLAAAKEVAKDLGPHTRVGPADAATKGLAEAQLGAIPDVIVTLGSEYAAR